MKIDAAAACSAAPAVVPILAGRSARCRGRVGHRSNDSGYRSTVEDRHLSRSAAPLFRVLVADADEGGRVAVSGSDARSPCLELGPGPFEAMVGVAELTGGQLRPDAVVFGVRRGDD